MTTYFVTDRGRDSGPGRRDYIWSGTYEETEKKPLASAIWILAAVRVVLCLFPQNRWLENDSGVLWGVIRNMPFVALGAIIVALYFKDWSKNRRFRFIWLLVTLHVSSCLNNINTSPGSLR